MIGVNFHRRGWLSNDETEKKRAGDLRPGRMDLREVNGPRVRGLE